MKTWFTSVWFRLGLCAVFLILCIAVPGVIVRTTHSNGIGAGVFVLTLFGGLPFTSLLCGIFASPDVRKLWFLPAVPNALYFCLFPILTDASPVYLLAQFNGLVIGYAAFILSRFLIRKTRSLKK